MSRSRTTRAVAGLQSVRVRSLYGSETEHDAREYDATLGSSARGSLILREDCYNVVTRAPAVGNNAVVPDSKREKGVHARAMLFWVLAALAVVGALAIDWALYLLVRRWL
jgi:hypothetical protein